MKRIITFLLGLAIAGSAAPALANGWFVESSPVCCGPGYWVYYCCAPQRVYWERPYLTGYRGGDIYSYREGDYAKPRRWDR